MILLKIILLQIFWLIVVMYGKNVHSFWPILLGITWVLADYIFSKPKISLGRYFFLITVFALTGLVNDSALVWFNLIEKNSYHYGNLSLWIIFIIYYDQIFIKFKRISTILTILLGGIAGAFTYWSAAKLGGVVIVSTKDEAFVISQFIFWAAFFPLSLKLYFEDNYWDKFLDKSIFFSFDQSGFKRHQKKFTEDLSTKTLSAKTILVTGATGGIGKEVAVTLAQQGAKVILTGRSLEKAESITQNNARTHFVSLDMANWKNLYQFAKECDVLDHVVFNAGSMPSKLTLNENGVEFQCASQLLGHYFLLRWLKEFKKIKSGARIVWVSSGGMYLKKLDLKTLFKNPNYEKVDTYANVKRAQVTLVEELAKKHEWKELCIISMHPGWVGTEGLKEALPQFYKILNNRLRSANEGADTILWCLLTDSLPVSGSFYFDRKQVSPYINKTYSPSVNERSELLKSMDNLRPCFDE